MIYNVNFFCTAKWFSYTFFFFFLLTQWCPTLCDPMDCRPPGSSVHGDSPGKNTGVGSLSLHQGIFPTQGSNPSLPHLRTDSLYHLSQGKPKNPHLYNQFYYRYSFSYCFLLQFISINCIFIVYEYIVQYCHRILNVVPMPYSRAFLFIHSVSYVGCYFLLQRIFPTQGSNPGLPHCRQILSRLSHQGCPDIKAYICHAQPPLCASAFLSPGWWDSSFSLEGPDWWLFQRSSPSRFLGQFRKLLDIWTVSMSEWS